MTLTVAVLNNEKSSKPCTFLVRRARLLLLISGLSYKYSVSHADDNRDSVTVPIDLLYPCHVLRELRKLIN